MEAHLLMDGARDGGCLNGQTLGLCYHLFQCLRATCEGAFGCVPPVPSPGAGPAPACRLCGANTVL
jgi:hypothetical protein